MKDLLTASEIILKEAEYRMNELGMSRRRAGYSLGYSEKGFRLMLERMRANPNDRFRLNNEYIVDLKNKNNSRRIKDE